jgi:hypothetical protein
MADGKRENDDERLGGSVVELSRFCKVLHSVLSIDNTVLRPWIPTFDFSSRDVSDSVAQSISSIKLPRGVANVSGF